MVTCGMTTPFILATACSRLPFVVGLESAGESAEFATSFKRAVMATSCLAQSCPMVYFPSFLKSLNSLRRTMGSPRSVGDGDEQGGGKQLGCRHDNPGACMK